MTTENSCKIRILIIQSIIVTSYRDVLPLEGNKKPLSKTHKRILKY